MASHSTFYGFYSKEGRRTANVPVRVRRRTVQAARERATANAGVRIPTEEHKIILCIIRPQGVCVMVGLVCTGGGYEHSIGRDWFEGVYGRGGG